MDGVLRFLSLFPTLGAYMIGSLRGRILDKGATSLVLEVAGVGYHLHVTPSTIVSLTKEEDVLVYIHDHIREDSHELYSFLSSSDRDFFERLLGVSGVGPKVGMTLMSVGSADTVSRAIMAGDLGMLTSVPGVGKKTAQKIILELKGQLVEAQQVAPGDGEVIAALESLGYSGAQAREVLKNINPEVFDTAARVREALRFLSR